MNEARVIGFPACRSDSGRKPHYSPSLVRPRLPYRDLEVLSGTNFGVHPVVGIVAACSQTRFLQFGNDALGVLVIGVADRNDLDLLRRQPRGERTGVVLDQNAEEALQRSEQGPVDHVWPLFGSVPIDEGHVEALRLIEIELNRRQLPLPPDRVLDLQVDLGPVECSAAFIDFIAEAFFLNRPPQRFGRIVPTLGIPHRFFGAGREICRDIAEAEALEHVEREAQNFRYFLLHLIGSHEEVRIILSEPADSEQAVHRPRFFVPIDRSKLRPAERKVPIGALGVVVDHDVEGTVHRLDVVVGVVHLHRRVHPFLVEAEVAAGFPQPGLADMRGIDHLIAVGVVFRSPKVFNLLSNPRPVGMPIHQT